MPQTQLLITTGNDTGRALALANRDPVSIGRGADCSLRLHDPSVSRVHCRLVFEGDELTIRDGGSRWGTGVNGQNIRKAVLKRGDKIIIGETEITVDVISDANGSTMAPLQPREDRTVRAATRSQNVQVKKRTRLTSDEQVLGLIGQQFLRFDVLSLLSSARTGAIFGAWDPKYERPVTLKIFWPHLFEEEIEVRRFVRAMRTAIPVHHENLVRVYTAGRSRGVCFTSCELIEGESADQLIQRVGVCGMLDWRRVLRIAIQLAKALQAASEHNMIHRNITPHNILIRARDDTVKLNDLVFAKAISGTRMEQITSPGELIGELVYMSPEQTGVDRPIDFRSDVYSLGATLYTLLTGHPPLGGPTTAETLHMIQCQIPAPPTTHHLSISPLFEGEVMRMLEKRPEDRHVTPAILVSDLQRVAKYEDVKAECVRF